ncbi:MULTISPECIES: TetR/AcrR family transcriptional regulator [Thermomonosporaceae]|uniref:TetR/AcrR family transcriptional regulator n=1 Tax=Thermomonosporaceae TaxID=2012 RepID=UPI00255AE163|nr:MULTISPECIES: TetR/AcrR family transcriptional regulator [Thermomonosporaceae]MDL4774295.1 TetR/AcrR family transcriptional regulator [Actinomadura xylanilytica]
MTSERAPWAAARSSREGREHETRSLLVRSAGRVFARRGHARTTIAGITAEAKVARATFYVYFASKEEVFRAVALGVRDAFLAAHEIPGVDEDDPYGLARESSARFLAAYAANLELLTVIEHQALVDPEIRAVWREIQERPLRRTARYIERITAQGLADPAAPPRVLAEATYGIFARFARTVPADPAGRERLVDELTAIYLRLLGVPPAG